MSKVFLALARAAARVVDVVEKRPDKVVIAAIMLLGVVLLVAAPATLVFMCLSWLKIGNWPDWSPIALGYHPAETSMLGFNKILLWIYNRQLALISCLAGIAITWFGIAASND